jgi:hypothetical protein
MCVTVSPVVYEGNSGVDALPVNYRLSRQIDQECMASIDLDVYEQDHFFPVANTVNRVTGQWVVPLTVRELLYLSGDRIRELATKSRDDDSLISPYRAPEAVGWYADLCRKFQDLRRRQGHLAEQLCRRGWEIPPCLRRLRWAELDATATWEACRITASFYASIHAGADEVWYQVMGLCRRRGLGDHQRRHAIVAFAIENPMLAECGHRLLQTHCPRGKCFLHELMQTIEQPYLF